MSAYRCAVEGRQVADTAGVFTSGRAWRGSACLTFPRGLKLYAYGYRAAAEQLVAHVLELGTRQDYMVFPICFLYRQYLELQLKALIQEGSLLLQNDPPPAFHHDLTRLWFHTRKLLCEFWPDTDLGCIERFLSDFADLDPNSETFRYPEDRRGQDHLLGLSHIDLEGLAEEFTRVADMLEGAGIEIAESLAAVRPEASASDR